MVTNLPAMQETLVWSLGQEDPLEKGMATHPNILAWRIPWTEKPELQSPGSHRVRHDWATNTFTIQGRQWHWLSVESPKRHLEGEVRGLCNQQKGPHPILALRMRPQSVVIDQRSQQQTCWSESHLSRCSAGKERCEECQVSRDDLGVSWGLVQEDAL